MNGDSMFKKILVCLDGSSLAEEVLPYAADMALHLCCKLVLLQVIDVSSTVYTPGQIAGRPHWLERIQKEETESGVYLERVALPLRERGLEVEIVTLQGAAGESIVSYAKENEVDLIAITTHARRNLGRLVFGSTADLILRESGLPTFSIKPKHTQT